MRACRNRAAVIVVTLVACRPPAGGQLSPIALPPALDVHPLQLPRCGRATLSNGLPVLLMPDHSLPLSTVELIFRAGSIDDPRGFEGLAEATISALREGTQALDGRQISDAAETAGARLGSRTDYELASLACAGRSRHAALCLRLLGQMISEPLFPPEAIERLRRRMISETRQARDDPATLVELHFDNQLLGDDHPYGRSVTSRSLRRIHREHLVEFHQRHLLPSNAVLVISGDIDRAALLPLIEAQFASWSAGDKKPPPRPPVPGTRRPSSRQVLLVDKPDLSQSFFALGHRGIARADRRRDAARVLNHVLSGLRLMKVVRARGGKTYSIRSRFDVATDDGTFVVKSFTRNAQLAATLALVFGELQRIRQQPPTPGEIRSAKGRLAGGYTLRFSTTAQLGRALGEARLLGLTPAYLTEMGLRIQRLSFEEIAAATRLIDPNNLTLVIVGPAAVVAPQLRRAKLTFETISHLAPISAAERRQARGPRISAAEQQRAREVLRRATQVAGPRPTRLKTTGRLRILAAVAGLPPLSGRFALDAQPPDRLRIEMDLSAEGTSVRKHTVQQLVGRRATIATLDAGKQQPAHALPPARAARLTQALWRQPVFLLHNALATKCRARLGARQNGRISVEIYAPGRPAMTLLFDARHHLVQTSYRDDAGVLRVTELSDHRSVSGVLVPHRVVTRREKRQQQWTIQSATVTK